MAAAATTRATRPTRSLRRVPVYGRPASPWLWHAHPRDRDLARAPGRCQQRAFANLSDSGDIAIVGGGLTGLTAAYFIAKKLPPSSRTKLTVYEGSDRLGGWIRTERLPMPRELDARRRVVTFERGPRTLSSLRGSPWRFDDLVLYELVLDLGLQLCSPPSMPRYIYYPDRLVMMPSSPGQLCRSFLEPVFYKSLGGMLGFMLRRWRLGRGRQILRQDDPSIADWLREVTGSSAIGDHLVSAMVHGIYGGDVERLSAAQVLDRAFYSFYGPQTPKDHVLMPAREAELVKGPLGQDPDIRDLALCAKGPLLHFGAAGMERLVSALGRTLKGQPNVEVRTSTMVEGFHHHKEARKILVETSPAAGAQHSPQTKAYDQVISTIPSHHLAPLTHGQVPSLADLEAVSIMTVNLWYPRSDIKPPGLGYLIPRSVPQELNPERALGVFFDSDVTPIADESPCTKLFVLLGGHYYDQSDPHYVPRPSAGQAIEQAKAVVERHLGIPRSESCYATAHFAPNCIPQHRVGHAELMLRLRDELRKAYGGRLAVAGGSYGRIGAMAALRAGHDTACQLLESGAEGFTGLESYRDGFPLTHLPKASILCRAF